MHVSTGYSDGGSVPSGSSSPGRLAGRVGLGTGGVACTMRGVGSTELERRRPRSDGFPSARGLSALRAGSSSKRSAAGGGVAAAGRSRVAAAG